MEAHRLVSEEQKQQLRVFLVQAVADVEQFLIVGDVNGANQYCDALVDTVGRGVHDLVLDVIAARRGFPSWRTVGHWPAPR